MTNFKQKIMKIVWIHFIIVFSLFSFNAWLIDIGYEGLIAQIAGYLLFDNIKKEYKNRQ